LFVLLPLLSAGVSAGNGRNKIPETTSMLIAKTMIFFILLRALPVPF
jgi:hypothetical protein